MVLPLLMMNSFLFLVHELEGFINSESFDCSLLIAGDFNVDFDRTGRNTTQLLSSMIWIIDFSLLIIPTKIMMALKKA